MLMLVDCSNCRTPLQLPPGVSSIRCSPMPCRDTCRRSSRRSPASCLQPPLPSAASGSVAIQSSATGPAAVGARPQESRDLRDLVPELAERTQGLHQRRQVTGRYVWRTIVPDQVYGKEQVVGRSFPSVAVMMIKPLLIQLLCPRSLQLVQ
ncbi:metacaspase 1 [Actinidia rufa]|uniref:Metacaspase 1 n=1 Tax=Actinidia rufa TaxID=165716 RepID=A0A7J0E6W4_9ERIC|nr:metacaspase 1 [Actinidia rufa]